MSGRLTLVCHASTEAVRAAVFPKDEPLDPRGRALAAALSSRLGRVDAAWTGPSLRARQTAAALRLDAAVEPALADIDLGRWAGHALSEIAAVEPDAVRAWTAEVGATPHGGESINDLLERVAPWLDARARDGRRTLAVTHAAVMRAALVLALDAKPLSFWRIDVAPLCRLELRRGSGTWRLRTIGPV